MTKAIIYLVEGGVVLRDHDESVTSFNKGKFQMGLTLELCLGQVYDGANNMSGKHTGVATWFLEDLPIHVGAVLHGSLSESFCQDGNRSYSRNGRLSQ